jgi:hypothetical protein
VRNGLVLRSDAAQTTRFLSSSATVATADPALRVSSADGAMIGTAMAVLLRSDRVSRLPPIRTAAHPALSSGTRAQLVLAGLGATRGPPPAAAGGPSPRLSSQGEALPSERRPSTKAQEAVAAPWDRRGASPSDQTPEDAEAGAPPPAVDDSGGPADRPPGSSEAAAPVAKPVKPDRIEMTIDSLPNYDLLQPIPVVIEALGDRLFSAQAPALEIAITGSSISGAFLQLKEQIAATYEQCRQKSTVTPERLHQLGLFQAYIGKAKRGWPLGRG